MINFELGEPGNESVRIALTSYDSDLAAAHHALEVRLANLARNFPEINSTTTQYEINLGALRSLKTAMAELGGRVHFEGPVPPAAPYMADGTLDVERIPIAEFGNGKTCPGCEHDFHGSAECMPTKTGGGARNPTPCNCRGEGRTR